MPPDSSEESRSDYELEIIDWIEGARYDEIIVRFPGGEVQRLRRYRDPRTTKEKRETRAAEKILEKLGPIESATHPNKERAHRRRKTRALGNRLRGEAQRWDEARRKSS
jgi:hypothetical protein